MAIGIDSFEITNFDLGLLGRLNFEGSLEINRRRPYGSEDVLADLREIYADTQGYELLTDETGTLNSFVLPDGQVVDAEEFDSTLWSHDRNMVTVLEIVLSNPAQGIGSGRYIQTRPYGRRSWERELENGSASAN